MKDKEVWEISIANNLKQETTMEAWFACGEFIVVYLYNQGLVNGYNGLFPNNANLS